MSKPHWGNNHRIPPFSKGGLGGVLCILTLWIFLVAPPSAHAAPVCACYYDQVQQYDAETNSNRTISRCTVQPAVEDFADASHCEEFCRGVYDDQLQSSVFETDETSQDAVDAISKCTEDDRLAQTLSPKAPIIDPGELDYIKPNLIVPVPNLTFTPILLKDGKLQINYIADYVTAVYRYLIGIAILFAIVMVMVGGLQYVLSSGSGDVGKAKSRIKSAMTGLVLLLSVTLILYTVNPKLTLLHSLQLQFVDPVELIKESGDKGGGVTTENLDKIGIICGTSTSVADIAKQFEGRTTYRFGGKGGQPPYDAETKKDASGRPYSEYCPEGTVCLDCSGFVAVLAECAGLPPVCSTCGTSSIFSSAPKITSCSKEGVTLDGGRNYTLQAGDLVGFKPGDYPKVPGFGHVWMYIGNGNLVNSAASGRVPGKGVKFGTLAEACKNYPLRLIER